MIFIDISYSRESHYTPILQRLNILLLSSLSQNIFSKKMRNEILTYSIRCEKI